MEMEERYSIPVQTPFQKVDVVNPEFTKYKCYIMALGKNRNYSFFSKEAVEKVLPSFAGIPVVANMYEGEDGQKHIGGHDGHYEEVAPGKWKFRSICVPYGYVMNEGFEFEEVTETDGTVNTYLSAPIVLWTGRYPDLLDAAYDEDVLYNQSMEINVSKSRELPTDKRYIDIMEFNPSALCLLGKSDDEQYNVEPCFKSASVIAYSFDENFEALAKELKSAFEACFAKKEVTEVNDKLNIDAILAEFGLERAQLDFEIAEDMTEEALREKLQEFVAAHAEPEAEVEPEQPAHENRFQQTFATYREKFAILQQLVWDIDYNRPMEDHWEGFDLMDFDDEYLFVRHWEYDPDEEEENVGRFAYAWNDEENRGYLTGEFEEMYIRWLTRDELRAVEDLRREYEAYCAEHTATNAEVEALRQFKADRLAEIHAEEVNAVLAQFADLDGNAEFEELRAFAQSFENIGELEEKCFAIRGRNVKVTFSKAPKPAENRIPVPDADKMDSPYGNLFELMK